MARLPTVTIALDDALASPSYTPGMPTRRRSEQLAEILVESGPVPPPEVPESHIALVHERLAEIDAGEVQLLQSADVWARLRACSKARARVLARAKSRPSAGGKVKRRKPRAAR
jgi:hypothetical protein